MSQNKNAVAKRTLPDNALTTTHNDLISLLSVYDGRDEVRLIKYCLAFYDARKLDNPRIEATVKDFAEFFNIPVDAAYSRVQRTVDSIMTKPIKFHDKKTGKGFKLHIFPSFHYTSGAFSFSVNNDPLVKSLALGLQDNFTSHLLSGIKALSSQAILFYTYLMQWQAKGHWYVTLDELRVRFGKTSKSYAKWTPLKRRLVDPLVEEINNSKYSEIELFPDYAVYKTQNTVTAVVFYIVKKARSEVEHDVPNSGASLHKMLVDAGLHLKTANTILGQIKNLNKEEYFLKKIPEVLKRHTRNKGPRPAYLTKALNDELAALMLKQNENQAIIDQIEKMSIDVLKNLATQGNEIAKVELERREGNKADPVKTKKEDNGSELDLPENDSEDYRKEFRNSVKYIYRLQNMELKDAWDEKNLPRIEHEEVKKLYIKFLKEKTYEEAE